MSSCMLLPATGVAGLVSRRMTQNNDMISPIPTATTRNKQINKQTNKQTKNNRNHGDES